MEIQHVRISLTNISRSSHFHPKARLQLRITEISMVSKIINDYLLA